MKNKLFMASIAVATALSANAATLSVEGSDVLVARDAYHPVLSADGSKLLYTAQDHTGLSMLDFNSNEVVEITDEDAAGFMPVFSKDGATVVYSCAKYDGKLRKKNVMRYNTTTDEVVELAPMSRENARIMAQNDGVMVKMSGRNITKVKRDSQPCAVSDYNKIIVENGGREMSISPVENALSYQWVSVSPNGKKLLFVEPYKGIFVSNLDGSELVSLGKGTQTSWMGDEFVLATRSTDDGYNITASQIIAIEVASGKVTEITASDSMTEEATASLQAGKIVVGDYNGTLRVMKIKVTE